ncbi:MAG: hypothetical protein JWP18_1154, partial [Solirubrobacterales bacterium]|nr:hypothetical protein [Solirubrobacterales bacterium]
YVVRMDAHTRYPEDYIAVGVARLAQGDVDHVSGPQLAAGYDAGSRRVAIALRSRLGVGGADFRRSAGEREVDSGFLGVWARERLVRLGGWDEAWVINQDAELAARLRADGGRLVCVPAMAAQYLPRNSLRALARQYFRYGRYRARTTLRHPTSLRKGHALPPGVVLASVGAVVLPRPLRRIARGGLTAYALALTAEGARLAATQDDATAADAVRLPAVFATMHLAWGAGVLAGLAQFSPTVRPGSGFGDRSAAGASSSSAAISRPARSAV